MSSFGKPLSTVAIDSCSWLILEKYKSGYSPPTSVISKVFSPAELLHTRFFFSILCRLLWKCQEISSFWNTHLTPTTIPWPRSPRSQFSNTSVNWSSWPVSAWVYDLCYCHMIGWWHNLKREEIYRCRYNSLYEHLVSKAKCLYFSSLNASIYYIHIAANWQTNNIKYLKPEHPTVEQEWINFSINISVKIFVITKSTTS